MKCGESGQRNMEYELSFNEDSYFKGLVPTDRPVIFDVGAHQGESIRFFRDIFPHCEIHSFEPDPISFREIPECAGVTKNNVALALKDETAQFYRQSISHLNSLNRINVASTDSLGYAQTAINQQIEVPTIRGDSYMQSNNIQKIDLLKIDVQGAEVDVLRGFGERLADVNALTVEIGFFDFYARKTSFYEIEQVIRKHFELWDILKISKNPKSFRTDWVEAVYRKVT